MLELLSQQYPANVEMEYLQIYLTWSQSVTYLDLVAQLKPDNSTPCPTTTPMKAETIMLIISIFLFSLMQNI